MTKPMYKPAGCPLCNHGYIYVPGTQYTPYHSESGFYKRCTCSTKKSKAYKNLLKDMSLTRATFAELLYDFYDNNYNQSYSNE